MPSHVLVAAAIVVGAATVPAAASDPQGLQIALISFAGAVIGGIALVYSSRHRDHDTRPKAMSIPQSDSMFDQSILRQVDEHGRRLDSHDTRISANDARIAALERGSGSRRSST